MISKSIRYTIDEDIARAEKAARVEIPADKWRDALYHTKAAIVVADVIEKWRNNTYNWTYGELVECIENILETFNYDDYESEQSDDIR